MANSYTVFVSHSWKYVGDLENMKKLLENRNYFNAVFLEPTPNEPINSLNANYIKQKIRERIASSDVVLGIAGVYATYSEWMAWELQTAYINRIPIIGVAPWGQERLSSVVQVYAKEMVRWNTESIVQAIRAHRVR